MISDASLENQLTLSIVNHGHCKMLSKLLLQINNLESSIAHVIITHNIQSALIIDENSFSFKTTVIVNKFPLGFGENHNQAFKFCTTKYFCVLNPDVEFINDPFNQLINCLELKDIGIAAPTVLDRDGVLQDSYRKFPTPLLILKRALFSKKEGFKSQSELPFIYPDWVAGMFMLLKSSTFKNLGGFDEKYFLYCEDIDLCLRSWRAKNSIIVLKDASIIHNAQRDSHTKPWYFWLHLKSLCRFFFKHLLRFPR